MTVREVVMLAAEELRIAQEVSDYFDRGSIEGKEKAELLLTCFNLVEDELALDYLPLETEEKLTSNHGQIYFDQLEYAPVRILKVCDVHGNSLDFKLYSKYLQTQTGAVVISYTYTPPKKGLDDESDFSLHISARLMVYGIAAEYTMAMGEFGEASLWDKKYKDAIEAAYHMKSGGRMASRRWV